MLATLNKITKHPSKFGGDFYYLFFKTEDGESCKSCVTPNYRNWARWRDIINNFKESEPILVDNLIIKNGIVDADSFPKVVNPNA